ncbi:helix-hairpin-helix domain-containing protein [Aerococcaceae bacterium WGS1372]
MKNRLIELKEIYRYIQDNKIKSLILVASVGTLLISILHNNQGFSASDDLLIDKVVGVEYMEGDTEFKTIEESSLIQEVNDAPEVIYVDVKGAVNQPNMYSFPIGSRVYDAIEAAGGFTMNAASDTVNQAVLLEDQMLLHIYTHEEVEARQEQDLLKMDGNHFIPSAIDDSEDSTFVNINIADEAQLMTLPNIGSKKAEAIIKYRQDYGSFIVIEDIMNVSGIGEKTFEGLKDYINVGP